MADIQYDVLANLTTKAGAFSSDMTKAAADADKLGASWGKVVSGGSALMGTLGGLVATAAQIGTAGAGVMLGAVGIAAHYVGGAMAVLESKSIQLASVLAAATKTPFDVMQKQTRGLFDEFKQDAIESAGETGDFVDIASKIAGPIMGAGKSMADLHRITKGVVEMAPSLGIDFKQAGSDVMRMLQGTAGMESPLFAAMVAIPSLGIKKAEEFNKLSPEKRIAKLEEALGNPAFRSAAAAYGASWGGLTSTFEDVAKGAGMMLGEPLFALAKKGLSAFNDSAMKVVQGQGGKQLRSLGTALTDDFLYLARVLRPIFPSFGDSAKDVVGVMEKLVRGPLKLVIQGSEWAVAHWADIKSHARGVADSLTHAAEKAVAMVRAIGGGDMARGIERIAKLSLAAKVASPVASMAVGGAGVAVNGARLLGLGASTGGVVAAGTAAAGAEAATVAGGAGAVGAATGGAGAVGAAALTGPIAVGVVAALAWVGAALVTFQTDLFGLGTRLSDIWLSVSVAATKFGVSLGKLWDAMGRLYTAAEPLIALIGSPLVFALGDAGKGLEKVITWFEMLVDVVTRGVDLLSPKLAQLSSFLGLDAATGGQRGKASVGFDEARETVLPDWALQFAKDNAAVQQASPDKKKPDNNKGKLAIEITHKWDLGEGNEEAIYVKTRKDIVEMFRGATGIPRMSRLAGT